ncbi:cysteine proteinase, partial [Coprinellus micaceus]
ILMFPPNAQGRVNLTSADAARLKPEGLLNDSLIEFYLKLWLQDLKERAPDLAEQVHIFSPFFYKLLNKKEYGFRCVRRWTSKCDLFAKKYVVVPINESMHWYLAVIYEPEHVLLPPPTHPIPEDLSPMKGGPGEPASGGTRLSAIPDRTTYIFLMDSLGKNHTYTAGVLKRYLMAEATDKKGVNPTSQVQTKSLNVSVPTQPNLCDCGLYVLHFVDEFVCN